MLKSIFAFAVVIGASVSVLASEGEHLCKSGKIERKVTIHALEEGKKAPCEVKYLKENGEEKVLFSAKNDEAYCSTKAHEFIASLKAKGFDCAD